MANYGTIKKDNLLTVKKSVPQTSRVRSIDVQKDQLLTLPGLTKADVLSLPTPKSDLGHLPYITKDTLNDLNTAVLQRANQLKYARFLRSGYTTDEEWQKVLDNAKMQADYSNAKQLNSYADVLASMAFGTKFENKGSVYKFLEDHGLTWNGPFNILGGLANLIDYTWQYNIKPITQGQWGVFGKNALMNFSETVDFLATPVKAVLIGKDFTDVAKSLGLTGDGRQNYDYDTGNKVVDMVLETISDPGVWASLGGWALAKGAVRAGSEIMGELTEATIKSGVKELAENVGEEATQKWLKKSFQEAVRTVSAGTAVDVSDISKILLRRSSKLAPEVAEQISASTVKNISEVLLKTTKQYTERTGVTILKTIDKLDTGALKISTAPIYGSYKAISKIKKTANSRALRVLDPFLEGKESVSPFDYEAVMSKVDEVNDSLIKAVEHEGLKSFDNAEVQKVFYKYTKEDIGNIQKIIKRHAKSKNVNFTALKFELAAYLTIRHNFDTSAELLDAFIKADPLTKFTESTLNKLQNALQAYLKDPFDGEAESYIKLFLPDDASVQKFIADNVDISKMLTDYSDVIDKLSAQTDLFTGFKGSIKDIGETFKKFQEAESFIKTFQESTVNKETVANILKALHTPRQFPLKKLRKIADDVLNDVDGLINSGLLKNISTSDFDTFTEALKSYMRNRDNPFFDYARATNPPIDDVSAFLPFLSYHIQNGLHAEAIFKLLDGAVAAADAERYLKLFLPEEVSVGDFVEQLFDTYAANVLADELLKPVYESLELSSKQSLLIYTHSEFLTKSFKESRLPELLKSSKDYAETVKIAEKTRRAVPIAPITALLSPEEALAIFKQSIINSLSAFYDTTADAISNFIFKDTALKRKGTTWGFEDAYRVLYNNIKNAYSDFVAYNNALLNNNPTLKSNIKKFENYGKELLSTSETQRKITELVKNVTAGKITELPFEDAANHIAEFKEQLALLLNNLTDNNVLTDVVTFSEDGEKAFLRETVQNALLDLDAVVNIKKQTLNVEEFFRLVQDLDSTVKYYKSRLDDAIIMRESTNLKAYEHFYNSIETVVNNAYELIKIPEATFSLLGDATVYALKQEQTFNTLIYLSNPTIMDFVHKTVNRDFALNDIITNYSDKEYVQTLINNATTAEEIALHRNIASATDLVQKRAQAIQEYELFINAIEKNTSLTQEIRSALLSTVNSPHIARMSVDDVATAQGQDTLLRNICSGIENYINAQRKTGRYTMDAFRTEQLGEGYFEKLLSVSTEDWLQMAHHADADVLTTIEYFKKELPDFQLRKNDITIDIETTSLNEFQGEALEVALNINGRTIIFKRHLDRADAIPVSNSLLSLYTRSGMSLDDARKALFEYYNRTYTGKQAADSVQYFDSEAELLQAVQNELYRAKVVLDESGTSVLKQHPDAPRLLGHNINGYDIDFLKHRADKNGIKQFNETLGRFEHVDSYQLIQEKYGFLKLTESEKGAIKDLMQDYITLRTMFEEGTADVLVHSGEDFINAIPNDLPTGLRRLAEHVTELDNTKAGIEAQKFFKDLHAELKQARIEGIRRPNREYAKHLFTEDQINSAQFKEALFDILRKDEHYKDYTDAQLKEFLNYLNPTKAFYSGKDLVNTIGFKKVFDPTLVKNWFNYTVDGVAVSEVPQKLGKSMFTIARHIERSASYVKNVHALEAFRPALDEFLQAIRAANLLTHADLHHDALRYLIPNAETISEKYGLALYLRQVLGNTKIQTGGTLIDLLPKNVIERMDEVVANHKLFTHSTISDTDLTFAELCKDLGTDEFWASAAVYEAKVADFRQNIDDFNFIDDFDKAGIFSPEKQIYAHGARRVLTFIEEWTSWLKGANTEQLYDAQAKTHFITEALNEQTLRNVMYYNNPEELVERLAWNFGGATFVKNEAHDIYRKLMRDKQAFENLGVLIYEDSNRVYAVLDRRVLDVRCEIHTDNHINTKHVFLGKHGEPLREVARPQLGELNVDKAVEACRKEFTLELGGGRRAVKGAIDDARLTRFGENLKNARTGINTVTNGRFAGCHADIMVKKTMRHLYERMPEAVQQAMGDINSFLDNPAWFSETTFNLFNLGSTSAKRGLQPGVPTNIMTSYELTTKLSLKTQETRLKFIDMILNNDMRLDIGVWADTANDTQVLKYLQDHPELTVAVLHKADNAQGYNIKRIAINTVEDLHNARRLRASVLTNSMYSRTASVVYSSVYDSGFLNGWLKIAKLYKIGQLSVFNFGTLMRNFFDSTLKMFISTEDFLGTIEAGHQARKNLKGYNTALYGMMATSQINTEAIERIARTYNVTPADVLNDIGYNVAWYKQQNIKDVINASVLYEKYNTALDDIIKMDSNAVLRPQNVDFYFNYMTKNLDKESFYEVHKFITQGASAGNTSALEKVFSKDSGKYAGKNILKQIGEVYDEQGLLDTIVHLTGKLSSANANLEQIIRLTQHMQQMRKGLNFAESNLRITKTHFDYADKTDITKSIELIFPYYNFKMKNFEYWADLIETKPWVARLFEDIMTPVWDFDSYDTYQEHLELANNESLTYQILAGNIPLNDSGLVLKLNPSIADAVQMVTNPFGTASGSLWSPLNEGFKTLMLELWKQGMTNDFVDNTFGLSEWAYEHQRTPAQKLWYNLPLVGPTLQRTTEAAPKYKERSGSNLAKVLPATFGVMSRWDLGNIKTPAEQDARLQELRRNYRLQRLKSNAQQRKYSVNRSTGLKSKIRATAKKSYYYGKSYNRYSGSRYYNSYNKGYADYMTYYNKPYNRYKETSLIHRTKVSQPQRVRLSNIYWKYYTKTGKRRMDILNAKATRKNLQMKIKLMYDYYR